MTEGGWTGAVKNIDNLILLDQVEGFLLGIAFMTILSAPIWAARKSVGWCLRKIREKRQPG